MRTGHGGCLLIAGEPGIGKSALVQALAERAAELAVPVYWGFCWEAGGAPAYWPWTQLLRDLTAERGMRQIPGLEQVLPEWATDQQDGPTLQPDQARFRLLEGVRALLTAASTGRPLIAILEDLHAADSDSLTLLEHLVRHLSHLPVLIVATFREMEARSGASAEILWRVARHATVLRPSRLDARDIGRYLEARTGRPANPATIERLLTVTEGNPLFLTEVVSLIADGEIPDHRLPDTVGQVIGQQLNRLPAAARTLLGRAAIIGREFDLEQLAALGDTAPGDIQRELEVALDLGLLERTGTGRLRFYHRLCCDVLLQNMSGRDREHLHRVYAAGLEREIAAGQVDRHAELATHLSQAGSDARLDAIGAWRAAARRARERTAFAESARYLDQALALFGEGPRFSPTERCELVLELAAANLTRGDIARGQALCREAFAFARTVLNPGLMAAAALTYGSAIVVGRVDQDLVSALQETLTRLDPDDIATRARVSARLAGALQPAPDPMGPLQMARDAIELARTTGDEQVIYEVLRSAVSAMMDFAPVDERIPLNREFGALAERFGDVAGQFRSALRLIIDAAELGDRRMLDEWVRACEQIAARIQLPHYQWRVASMHALQASIDGRFAEAVSHLDQAAELAREADDDTALMTIPIQQLCIIQEWASPEAPAMSQVSKAFDKALEIFPDAEIYVRPLFTSYLDDAGRRAVLADQPLVDRILRGGDRFTIVRLGELAADMADRAVLDRCYAALLPYRDGCATLGLMGSCWSEPVANALGVIAVARGELETAADHYAKALEVCRRMGAKPCSARVLQNQASLASLTENAAAAATARKQAAELIAELELKETSALEPPDRSPPREQPAAPDGISMERQGDVWQVGFDGEQAAIKASRGLEILSRLIASPDQEIHVLDLVGGPATAAVDPGDSGPALDDAARNAYQARIAELREQLEEAESLGDSGRADQAREELDFITRELSRAYGLHGRARPTGRAAERARVNVQRRLRDAVQKIEAQLPNAGTHLKRSLKTGSYCRYHPGR